MLDTGHIPEPVTVDMTINSARFVRRDGGYYVILNATYHYKTPEEIASLASFSWILNEKKGMVVPSENPIYQYVENHDVDIQMDDLEWTSEYVQFYPISSLREKDDIIMDVGGLTFHVK